MPCLEPGCAQSETSTVKKDELCAICFTSELSEEPCQRLECGHIFHAGCVTELLKHGWSTLKISFAFMSCPSCKAPIEDIDNSLIQEELNKMLKLKAKVEDEALTIAKR